MEEEVRINARRKNLEMIRMKSGCTANVIRIYENKLYEANKNDSGAVLFLGGRAIKMSNDHKRNYSEGPFSTTKP